MNESLAVLMAMWY